MAFRGIRRIYNRFFSKEEFLVIRMRGILGYTPAHIHYFKKAFLHKSEIVDKYHDARNNERLEFLGDAMLGMVVAEYLFCKYPGSDEGFLTKMRSKIVKRKSLNDIADKMELDTLITHYNEGVRISPSMLGNCLEALLGAVYLDGGYHRTKEFIVRRMLQGDYLDVQELENYDDNYKSQLLEWCQKNNKLIEYKVVERYKQSKRDRFRMAVIVDDQEVAQADDFNKKSAEQTASMKALLKLGVLKEEEMA